MLKCFNIALILSLWKEQQLLKLWRHGVVVITTAQLHSTSRELRFCAASNPGAACRRFAMVSISDNNPGWK